MYTVSPEQRHQMWDTALAHRGDERTGLLHYIVADIHAELSALDLYAGYLDPLTDSIHLLDSSERFFDHDMLTAYQALGAVESDADEDTKAEAPGRLLAGITARLSHLAADESVDWERRGPAAELTEFWRRTLEESPADEYLSVSQLAARHGVTPQAVYKWIHSGKIEADERPGGSYRIPAAQFRTSPATLALRAETRQKLVALQGAEPVTEEEILTSLRANRHANESR